MGSDGTSPPDMAALPITTDVVLDQDTLEHATTLGGSSVGVALTLSPGDSDEDVAALALFPLDDARYDMGDALAQGGMGRIVQARDLHLRRPVVIKEMLRASSEGARRRFAREAFVSAQLQHPGIVNVYDAGVGEDGNPRFVMERIRGRDFGAVIKALQITDERLAQLPVVLALADAMAYAHNQGVIHRDLKPANILVGQFGETVVIDWGLAKVIGEPDVDVPDVTPIEGEGELTMAGKVMGTPAYMPFEQAEGRPLDARADVYAIGAILYALLCGKAPYEGRSIAVFYQLAKGPPQPLGERVPGLPPALTAIVNKAMARDRDGRYPDAGALAQDLRRFTSGQLVGAHQYSAADLVRRWIKRNRVFVMTAGVAAILLAVVGTLSVTQIQQKNSELRATASELSRSLTRIENQNDALGRQKSALERQQQDLQNNKAQLEQRLADMLHEEGRRYLVYAKQALSARNPMRAQAFSAKALGISDGNDRLRVDSQEYQEALDILSNQARQRLLWQHHLERGRDADPVHTLRHSPDGTVIGLGKASGQVVILDAGTGQIKDTFKAHTSAVTSLAFSPNGARLASSGEDAAIKVWNLVTGSPEVVIADKRDDPMAYYPADLPPPPWHCDRVNRLAFRPHGQRLVSSGSDSERKVWDAITRELLLQLACGVAGHVAVPEGCKDASVITRAASS